MPIKLLGADPEFLLMRNGARYDAADCISNRRSIATTQRVDVAQEAPAQTHFVESGCDCSDCTRIRTARACAARDQEAVTPPERREPTLTEAPPAFIRFGYDGASIAAEIRPDPCYSPTVLVRNIREALVEGRKRLKNEYEWVAGTGVIGGHPTGGHLHLGINNYNANKLDVYIGIPLLALEPQKGRIYRRSNHYGQWGDCRRNDWGVEYRTPSSWLVSPAVTGIAAALGWLVARNWRNLPLPVWHGERYNFSFRGRKQAQPFQNWLSRHAIKVLGELRNLNDYKKVAGLLDPYKFIADVVGDWQEDRDMLDTWHLRRAVDKKIIAPIREEIAEENNLGEGRSSVVWNRNDLYISKVEEYCGGVQSAGHNKLWTVGAKKKRGSNLLLSPALSQHERVHCLLEKHKLSYCEWPDYPERNGELVIGIPLEYRQDHPDMMGKIVRLIALSVFDRMEVAEKKGSD